MSEFREANQSSLESTWVKLRLSNDKKILNALRKRKKLVKDENDNEYATWQFDSKEFTFRPGAITQLPYTVAKSLMQASVVIVGDDLTGDMYPALEVISKFQIGTPEEVAPGNLLCPVCGKAYESLINLSRHLADGHKGDRPDLYKPTKRESYSDQWEKADAEVSGGQEATDSDAGE